MNFHKIISSLAIAAVVTYAVILLWKQVYLLYSILIVLGYLKHRLLPIKQELACFIVCGMLGSLGESIIILSGAWSYTLPQFINVPFWLFPLWGIASTTGITLYNGIIDSKKRK